MKIKSIIYSVLLAGLLLPLLLNCKKEAIKTPPTVTISVVTNIASTTANSGGEVTSDGGVNVTERGVCWSVNQNPTTSDSKIANGTGLGSFTSSLEGLALGTIYNIKAYAINSVGTSYSSQSLFTTIALAPVLTTTELTDITSSSATGGGNITNDGGSPVTARGVCWSTNQNPTIADIKTSSNIGTGSFAASIAGLLPGKTYYFRAFATNSIGTAYGNQITTTTTAILSLLTTNTISAITATTVTSGGNITNDGGSAVTACGVCWSTLPNPTTVSSKTSDAIGSDNFTSSIAGLTPGATYYFRAYATNNIGTAYGNELSTNTTATLPSLTTTSLSAITATTAMSGGNITSNGGATITARGVCWSTTENPTISGSKTSVGTGSGSFTSSISDLKSYSTYYFRAYATNNIGTAYGNQLMITTAALLPVITTTAVSAITAFTATSGGNVISDGGFPITFRGVCWSTSPNPITNSKTINGAGLGSFESPITGLRPNTTYYIRAYAVNIIGAVYGNEITITTTVTLPAIDTNNISAITLTTAIGGGLIYDTVGSSAITARGVCWSTSQDPTITDSKTIDGTGTSGFTSSITGLTPGTLYYIRAYATISIGTAYGTARSFTTPDLTVSDIDGNIYHAITIGNQVWMLENLKTTRYSNGDPIPNVANSWTDLTTGAYSWLNNDAATNKAIYGALYNWYSLSLIAPKGWHVPSDAEWKTLSDYLGGESIAGGKLKESGLTHWSSPNTSATNSSGFTALPSTGREATTGAGLGGSWWSTTQYGMQNYETTQSWAWSTSFDSSYFVRARQERKYGLSVRCIKD